MHDLLAKNVFLVKEHVGMFKAANNFDIFDPESGQMIMMCREEKLGFITKMLRFTDYKRMTPFHVEIKDAAGNNLVSVRRGASIWRSKVEVLDENDHLIGIFRQKIFTIGGGFKVLDPQENEVCQLKGK